MFQASGNLNQRVTYFTIAALTLYTILALFGGLPESANLTGFVVGLIVLFVLMVSLFGFIIWALVLPLPEGVKPSKVMPLTRNMRQTVALLSITLGMVGVLGGLWDVVWHVNTGLPFGEDFFWEPHQFIYVALTFPILAGAFIWYRIFTAGSGSLRQRLRADVPVTLIMLGGVASAFLLPADPIWHLIYGEDLTGLSVPHFVFSVSGMLSKIGVLAILLSYLPTRSNWSSLLNVKPLEMLIIVSFGVGLAANLMPTLGDWEAIMIGFETLPNLPALVAARPDWAVVFLAAFISIFGAVMATRVTKLIGAATAMWVIGIVFRSGGFFILGYTETGATNIETWGLLLPFVLVVEAVNWYEANRRPVPIWGGALLATVVGSLTVIPLIPIAFTDPIVSMTNIPSMIIAIFVSAFVATLMARTLADIVHRVMVPQETIEPRIVSPYAFRLVTAVMSIIIVAAVYFIIVSEMPTA